MEENFWYWSCFAKNPNFETGGDREKHIIWYIKFNISAKNKHCHYSLRSK